MALLDRRVLHCYARLNYTGLLLIDDDSEPECFDTISKLVTRYRGKLNIRLKLVLAIQWQDEPTESDQYDFTLKNITTKYYSISSDDDFQFQISRKRQ